MIIIIIIIEPTRNCLINKANRKHSNTWVKRCIFLLINFVCAQVFHAFCSAKGFRLLVGVTSSASVRGPSVPSWAPEEGVYICHVHLHAFFVTNCITGAVWGNLDLTNNDHKIIWACIFCLEWLKVFFCIGVVSWPSCDYFRGKIKTEGMRHACPLLWELWHEKKMVFLNFDVHLSINFYVLVKVWSIYLNFILPLSNRVVPILALYWAMILFLFYALNMWSATTPQSMAWLFVCYAEHVLLVVACFVKTCQLGLNPEGLLLLERGLYKLRHQN